MTSKLTEAGFGRVKVASSRPSWWHDRSECDRFVEAEWRSGYVEQARPKEVVGAWRYGVVG